MNSSICSATDLLTASEEIASRFGDKDVWWRGHANASWNLQPRIFRGEIQEYSIEYEMSLTGNFMRQARLRSDHCPYVGVYPDLEHLSGYLRTRKYGKYETKIRS